MVANQKIRQAAKAAKVPFWRIADEVGLCDTSFTKKLRHELPQEDQTQILAIIERLKEAALHGTAHEA